MFGDNDDDDDDDDDDMPEILMRHKAVLTGSRVGWTEIQNDIAHTCHVVSCGKSNQ